MVRLFYELGVDISLNQVFLSSIPASLTGAAKRLLQARSKRVIDCTVGEIQQEICVALEDACMKKEAIREVLKGDKSMEKACKRPELYIKCSYRDKTCSCPIKKKKHYNKWKFSKGSHWKKMMWNPLFSLDEEARPSSIAALEVLTNSNSSFSESESNTCYMAADDTEGIRLVNSVPHVPVSVYTSKYAKPIRVIAFLDTRAVQTIMSSKVLPQEYWKPHTKHFSTAFSEVFSTHLISKPIKIQFFHGCFLITRVLGSALPRKDIVVGWDIIIEVNKLRMTLEGIYFKYYFQSYVQIPRLFMAQEDEVKQILSDLVQDLKQQSCADSHQEFLKKCSHPLWKNEQFFVRLPFKKNEDINPTKANHSGMNPEHQQLAIDECAEQLQQDLIEPSDSPWACEVFYVNKRSEQFANGQYQPEPHVVQELLKYLEESLTKKQEIPAVMNGIKKFEFHLVGHRFLVEIDMSSFLKMLQFKRSNCLTLNCLGGQKGFPSLTSRSNTLRETQHASRLLVQEGTSTAKADSPGIACNLHVHCPVTTESSRRSSLEKPWKD
ncbi:hypothetical protein CRG98_035443 [Punica granatum]|uniref:Uncharacterized protein n=1 Tax=Punica granatum TaxID=22663 RepID=A0A2I0IKC2_PUNGR|nr:hypothetical protein CRG98_035443 [Punica granatum]